MDLKGKRIRAATHLFIAAAVALGLGCAQAAYVMEHSASQAASHAANGQMGEAQHGAAHHGAEPCGDGPSVACENFAVEKARFSLDSKSFGSFVTIAAFAGLTPAHAAVGTGIRVPVPESYVLPTIQVKHYLLNESFLI